MTHNFTTLTTVLGRCSDIVADQVIAEIRSAINTATQEGTYIPESDLTEVSAAVHQKKAEQAAARRAKAAARKAQKAAQAADSAEQSESPRPTPAADSAERSESPRSGSVAVASRLAAGSGQPSGAEAPDTNLGSCGEAEAELPPATHSPSAENSEMATYFTPAMVKYLRHCPDQYMLAVLNSYLHLIF
ncbi:MAG: hypothetical protein ACI4AM_09410, partial [Muribaculaceae bacterium]